MTAYRLLTAADGLPCALSNPDGRGDVVLVCEHAGALLPERLGTLGLDAAALRSHIAWDPGALKLSERLSDLLDAPLLYQRFSRLAYDCNRPPHSPSAMPIQSEIHAVPGNRDLAPEDRQARIDEIYLPFRDRLADLLSAREAAGRASVLVTVHSFTPVYFGARREVEIGILHDRDSRMADAMLKRARDHSGGYVTRRNEPYGPADGVTHTLIEHGAANDLANVMIEVRNDRLADEAGIEAVALYLAGLVRHGAGTL